MAFTLYTSERGAHLATRQPTDRVTIGRPRKASGAINLGGLLMQRLGWKHGDKVGIYIGEGDDAGWICVAKDKNGYTISANSPRSDGTPSSSASISFSHLNRLIDEMKAVECQKIVREGALYFKLPAFLISPAKTVAPHVAATASASLNGVRPAA